MTTSIHGTPQGANTLSRPEDRYGKASDPVERRRLIAAVVAAYTASEIAPLVRRLLPRSPEHWAEAVQAGSVGLLEALQVFDPARGVGFWTFARYRVRDAVRGWMDVGVYWRKVSNRGKGESRRALREAAKASALPSLDLDAVDPPSDVPDPEELYEQAELKCRLFAFVETLNTHDQATLLADNTSRVSARHHKSLVAQARAAFGQKGGE